MGVWGNGGGGGGRRQAREMRGPDFGEPPTGAQFTYWSTLRTQKK